MSAETEMQFVYDPISQNDQIDQIAFIAAEMIRFLHCRHECFA